MMNVTDQQSVECSKGSLKRKLAEFSTLDFNQLDDDWKNWKVKRFKNNLVDRSSNERIINTTISQHQSIRNHQFKRRTLKNYSNKKKVLKNERKKSTSKLNLNNLSIFDTKSVYKFKFDQNIKRIFEKIQSCSYDGDHYSTAKNGDILDLNQLFQFNDSNPDTVLDDKLINSLKASFLGRGSYGKVFLAKLEKKFYAIKIGLSNSFYGSNGEQNALILNGHPNVVLTHHILKLKLTNDDQLLKKNRITVDEFPMVMSTNISYHTMKHIVDLNLLKLIDLFPKHNVYSTLNVIIMDFAGDLSLQQLIDDSANQTITKERRIHFAKQIADALVYLRNKSIAHLDLKPANIMIRNKDDLLKLIDFGCSKKFYCTQVTDEVICFESSFDVEQHTPFIDTTQSKYANTTDKENHPSNKLLNLENTIMSSLIKNGKKLIGANQGNIGTISHTAPEIFRNDTVKSIYQADVYSFAIILWQLVTREIPYSGDNLHSIIYRVASGKLRPRFDPIFQLAEKNYTDLTTSMWNNLPERRPAIEYVFRKLNENF